MNRPSGTVLVVLLSCSSLVNAEEARDALTLEILWPQVASMTGLTVVILALSVWLFQRRLD